MDRSFKILLEQINSNLDILNKNNFKIYDIEDTDFYISKIEYDDECDALVFKCEDETLSNK